MAFRADRSIETEAGFSKYEKEIVERFLKQFAESLALIASRLELKTVAIGTQVLGRSMYHYYEKPNLSAPELASFLNRVLQMLLGLLAPADEVRASFQLVTSVFSPTSQSNVDFLYTFGVDALTINPAFQKLDIDEQITLLNNLTGERGALKNRVFEKYWDVHAKNIAKLPTSRQRDVLRRLISLLSVTDFPRKQMPFFNDSGIETWSPGSSGINVIVHEKSVYGAIAKALLEVLNQSQKAGELLSPQDFIDLIKADIVPDLEDVEQFLSKTLDSASVDDFLKIANALEAYLQRSNLKLDTYERGRESVQSRIADYHDTFILAAFFRQKNIPFVLAREVYRKDLDVKDRKKKDGFYERAPNYTGLESFPLLLAVRNEPGDSQKSVFRTGYQVSNQSGASVSGGWSFSYNRALIAVLEKHGFNTTPTELRELSHLFVNKTMLSGWMGVFYGFSKSTNGKDTEPLLPYLDQSTDGKSPVAIGQNADNPISVVQSIRELVIYGGRSLHNMAEVLAIFLGYQLWGDRPIEPRSPNDVRRLAQDLRRLFPIRSNVRDALAQNVWVSFLSERAGAVKSITQGKFWVETQGDVHDVEFQAFGLSPGVARFVPSAVEASKLIGGYHLIAPLLSPSNREYAGRLLYRILQNNPDLPFFAEVDANIKLIDMLIPGYSLAKDDLLNEALDRHEVDPDQYRRATLLTSRFAYQDSSANKTFTGLEAMRALVRRQNREERKKLLLWLITENPAMKPDAVLKIEHDNNANMDELVLQFKMLTPSERLSLLDEIGKGEEGLLNVEYEGSSSLSAAIAADNTKDKLLKAVASRYSF